MLSRRLDVQIKLINRASMSAATVNTPKAINGGALESPSTPRGATGEDVSEGDKERERAIIQAALSVAEICKLVHHQYRSH